MSRSASFAESKLPSEVAKFLSDVKLSSPAVTRSLCQSTAAWLQRNQHSLRDFFRECFPVLLERVFGLERSGMLSAAGGDDAACKALLSFLAVGGPLFQAMQEVDTERLDHYRLPTNKLAAYTQRLLCNPAGLADLQRWPQYAEALHHVLLALHASTANGGNPAGPSPGIQLPPGYLTLPLSTSFLAIFAYAATTGSSSGSSTTRGSTTAARLGPSAGSHWPHLPGASLAVPSRGTHSSSSNRAVPASKGAYLRLLQSYLHALVPQGGEAIVENHYRVLAGKLMCILIEFWLTDLDMPGPAMTRQRSAALGAGPDNARGASQQQRNVYVVPRIMQSRAIQELVSHVYLRVPPLVKSSTGKTSTDSRPAVPLPAQDESNWLPLETVHMSGTVAGYALAGPIAAGSGKVGLSRHLGPAAGQPVQSLAAHVYRYLRRAFALWPVSTQQDALVAVIDLWLSVCFPWQTQNHSARYKATWRNHVLAHLPFYHILFKAFLELLLATAYSSPDTVANLLLHVAETFASETELLRLLEEAENALVAHASRAHLPAPEGSPTPSSAGEATPWYALVGPLAAQAAMLERAALAGYGGRSVRGGGEGAAEPSDGGSSSFQLFARHLSRSTSSKPEELGAPGAAAAVLEVIKSHVKQSKFLKLRKALAFIRVDDFMASAHRHTLDLDYTVTSRMLRYGGSRGLSKDQVVYTGNILLRPMCSNELHALAPILAQVSLAVNHFLGCPVPGDDTAPSLHTPAPLRPLVSKLKKRRAYVDLRRAFELQSVLFWSILALCLYHLLRLFLSFVPAIAVLALLALVAATVTVAAW